MYDIPNGPADPSQSPERRNVIKVKSSSPADSLRLAALEQELVVRLVKVRAVKAKAQSETSQSRSYIIAAAEEILLSSLLAQYFAYSAIRLEHLK